ncbi:hypothetical protein IKD56_00065 [bacterium]|nr:hypothetical protein [bacterium]
MEIIQTFYIYKCLECGNEVFFKDVLKNECYCCRCGLIHDLEMLADAKENYFKNRLNQIKKNNPKGYELILREIRNDKWNILKDEFGCVRHGKFKRKYFKKI